jgi:hypothetical protein
VQIGAMWSDVYNVWLFFTARQLFIVFFNIKELAGNAYKMFGLLIDMKLSPHLRFDFIAFYPMNLYITYIYIYVLYFFFGIL